MLQTENPLDAIFEEGVNVPDGPLHQGWLGVLAYMRALRQGGEPWKEVRVLLLGNSMQGKTSLCQAILKGTGLTEKIDPDDRTLAVETGV